MSDLKQSSVALLEEAIDRKVRNAQKGRDTTLATVTRIDSDGTTWVRVYGGADETPVRRMTSSAQVGDTVNVVFSGLSCMGAGNVTSPSASVVQVDNVEIAARGAAVAAQAAWAHADDAAVAAQTAWSHADDAASAAQNAWEHADDAADAASSANRSANSALTQLSIVEDVAGTLDWISKHGQYVATTDTTVVADKVYFEKDGDDYTPVVSPDPSANPRTEGWYVLDVTDSQSDFIMAHLAVTSRGLWVLPSGIGSATDEQHAAGYKVLLSSDGMYVYDSTGALVIKYGENIEPSTDRPFYIGDPNSTSYILFTPASGGNPAHISIGGGVTIGSDKTLSELLTADDINVGGRNLLLGTDDWSNWTHSNNVSVSDGIATYASQTSLAWNNIKRVHIPIADVTGDTLTLSFDYRSDDFSDASGDRYVYVNMYSSATVGGSRTKYRQLSKSSSVVSGSDYLFIPTTTWQRASLTFVFTGTSFFDAGSGDANYVGIEFYNHTLNHLQIRKAKLERGNVATDWTPAPEDQTTYVDNSVYQSSQPNLSPYFSAPKADASYWKRVVESAQFTTYRTQVERDGVGGWAHFAGNVTSGRPFVRFEPTPLSLKPSTDYTFLIEIATVQAASTITSMNLQLTSGTAQTDLVDPFDSYLYRINVLNANGSYRVKARTRADLSDVTGLSRSYLQVYGTGEFDLYARISLYEGDYQGPYKPYVGNLLYGSASDAVEYIVGTQTAATGSWTGVTKDSSLYAGKTIAYKLPYAGSGSASLQLKDSAGNNVGGNIPVYSMTTRVTTHYPAQSVIQMTFDGTNWRTAGWYNTNDTARYVQYYNSILAGENLTAASIIGGRSDGKFYELSGSGDYFELSYPLLWTTAAISSGGTNYANIYTQCYDRNLGTYYTSFNTGGINKLVYMVGTVSGNKFTLYGSTSATYLTCNEPTSEDGLFYIPIGRLGNQSNGKNYFNFQVGVPVSLYAFLDGKFRQVTPTEVIAEQHIYCQADSVLNAPTAPSAWITATGESVSDDEGMRPNLIRNADNIQASDYVLTRATVEDGVIRLTPTTSAAYAKAKVDYLDYADFDGATVTASVEARLADVTSDYTGASLSIYIGVQPTSRLSNTISSSYDRYNPAVSFTDITSEWKVFSVSKVIPTDLTTGKAEALVSGSYVTMQATNSASKQPVDVRNFKISRGGAIEGPYWTTKRPTYRTTHPVAFVAVQRKRLDGTVTCTTPLPDDSTTVIDGGHIITGTIDASQVNVINLDAASITSGTIDADRIDVASLEISTSDVLGLKDNIGSIEDAIEDVQEQADDRFGALQDSIDGQADSLSSDISALRSQVESQDSEHDERLTAIETHISFTTIGSGSSTQPAMVMNAEGTETADMEMVLTNTELGFYDHDEKVAWVSNRKMHNTELEVTGQASLGNFAYVPMSDGSLAFKWVG